MQIAQSLRGGGCLNRVSSNNSAARCLHCFMCCLRCAFWHDTSQYFTALQPLHVLWPSSPFPHAAHFSEVFMPSIFQQELGVESILIYDTPSPPTNNSKMGLNICWPLGLVVPFVFVDLAKCTIKSNWSNNCTDSCMTWIFEQEKSLIKSLTADLLTKDLD